MTNAVLSGVLLTVILAAGFSVILRVSVPAAFESKWNWVLGLAVWAVSIAAGAAYARHLRRKELT